MNSGKTTMKGMEDMIKRIQYFNFQNALEAIEYYEEFFDAKLISKQMGDDEMFADSKMPESVDKDFVMHAEIEIFGYPFYISSTWGNRPINNEGAMVCFTFKADDEAEKEKIMTFYQRALDAGVQVDMPMEETEWTSMFASFTDRHGVNWMLSGE